MESRDAKFESFANLSATHQNYKKVTANISFDGQRKKRITGNDSGAL